jgi:hypothetical protein
MTQPARSRLDATARLLISVSHPPLADLGLLTLENLLSRANAVPDTTDLPWIRRLLSSWLKLIASKKLTFGARLTFAFLLP